MAVEFCPRINWATAVLLLTFLLAAVTSTWALPAGNYDDSLEGEKGAGVDVPSLYELMLQRELMDKMMDNDRHHFVVRKSERYPSLRLRFGRRADPAMAPKGQLAPPEQQQHD